MPEYATHILTPVRTYITSPTCFHVSHTGTLLWFTSQDPTWGLNYETSGGQIAAHGPNLALQQKYLAPDES